MPTPASNLIDTRAVPAPGREAAILGQLDSLEPGGSCLLLFDAEARPVLAACRAARPGAFDWALLEDGPPLWRVEIRRRPDPGTRHAVREYLQWDHERLDLIFQESIRLAGAGARAEAATRFADFRTGLLRHIRMEEEILFPAFVLAVGDAGPTSEMLREHGEIQGLLAGMAAALESDEAAAGFASLTRRLMTVLGHHNAKEERVVYPATDRRLPPSEREGLVLAMQRI